jgi:hypothetical protein
MLRYLALALVISTPCLANDSVAEIGTGGLVLGRSDAISIDREELFVSLDRIDVAYRFRNHRDEPVETIVAFLMPDIRFNPWGDTALPEGAADNFLGFSVMADGMALEPALEQRAFAAGIDVTDELRARGIPLFPFGEAAFDALSGLPSGTIDDWIARGIVHVSRYGTTAEITDHYEPFWTLKSTYWWRMTFPPGLPVMVEHTYRPSVGGTVGVTFFEDGRFGGPVFEEYRRRYCMDDAFLNAIRRRMKAAGSDYPPFFESRIAYVLGTGANWLGPIATFRLTVDKGDEDNLVSFCGRNVRKIGPTLFEMTVNDYMPPETIEFLVLRPAGS